MEDREKLMWAYLDGNLNSRELERFNLLLNSDLSFRNEFKLIESLNRELQEVVLETPSENFQAAVLERINTAPVQAKVFSIFKILLPNMFIMLAAVFILKPSMVTPNFSFDFTQYLPVFSLPEFSLNINQPMITLSMIALGLIALFAFDRFFLQKKLSTKRF